MKFSIITLGCKVNAYESQYYAGQLEELGYEVVNTWFTDEWYSITGSSV